MVNSLFCEVNKPCYKSLQAPLQKTLNPPLFPWDLPSGFMSSIMNITNSHEPHHVKKNMPLYMICIKILETNFVSLEISFVKSISDK